MKNADMTLGFKSDNAMMVFGEPVKLRNTISGHYAIPITTSPCLILSRVALTPISQ